MTQPTRNHCAIAQPVVLAAQIYMECSFVPLGDRHSDLDRALSSLSFCRDSNWFEESIDRTCVHPCTWTKDADDTPRVCALDCYRLVRVQHHCGARCLQIKNPHATHKIPRLTPSSGPTDLLHNVGWACSWSSHTAQTRLEYLVNEAESRTTDRDEPFRPKDWRAYLDGRITKTDFNESGLCRI